MTLRRLAPVLLLAAVGCGEDADILARVGRKVGSKAEASGREMASKLAPQWETARPPDAEPGLQDRVAARLRDDQLLAGRAIEVSLAAEDVIELVGEVANGQQRQRAVELAQSTVGVVGVVDRLQVPEAPAEPPSKESLP